MFQKIEYHVFMFSLEKNKIKTLEIDGNNEVFYNVINDNEFPIRKYIEKKYNCSGSFFYSEDIFNKNVLDFLLEHAKLLSSTSVGNISKVCSEGIYGIKGATFWFFYKNIYIRASLRDQPDDYETYRGSSFSAPPTNNDLDSQIEEYEQMNLKTPEKTFNMVFAGPVTNQNFPLKDFEKFIVKHTKGKVHLFIKNQYSEYDFEPIKIQCKDMDLEINYGKQFEKIHNTIVKRLTTEHNGLYMFHGLPGTGKTTYIKHLTNIIDRDFIYIPTNMLEYFTSDPNSMAVLLRRPNSVLILEDAEKAILKREGGENSSSVSSLLNLSDGIMSDIMKVAIILTYNCPRHDIDDALKRKGRLQMDYEFGNLSQDDAIKLAKKLNFTEEYIEKNITSTMALADIYNLQKEIDFQENKEPKNKIIGFGK